MPFSLLANPTLAMLIELVPLAFVTMSSVAIAATAAASNRFNESPRVVVWLRARRPPTPRMHLDTEAVSAIPTSCVTCWTRVLLIIYSELRPVSTALSHPATHPSATLPIVQTESGRESRMRWIRMRVRRHWEWGRAHGFRRLIEEDQLNPLERVPLALRKLRWRRTHTVAPGAVPVYLVGVQRSGTNMLVRGLERSPEFEVRNENDGDAFQRFQLRPDPVVRDLVMRSGHRYVLFKPLCDSHRVDEILDRLGTPSPGRAIWAYRDVDGRVRSALAKFGSNNLDVLTEIAAGRGDHRWQARGMSAENRALVESFDYSTMTPESAAALFWYVRNSLYFERGLDQRDDVTLACYDRFLADPDRNMRALCAFLDFPFDASLAAHIERREAPERRPLEIDPEIRRRCDDLAARLEQVPST